MSHSSSGISFGGVIMQLIVSILRMIGFLIAWLFKAVGFAFETLSHFTFKLIGK